MESYMMIGVGYVALRSTGCLIYLWAVYRSNKISIRLHQLSTMKIQERLDAQRRGCAR
jgi:hypothetical protein